MIFNGFFLRVCERRVQLCMQMPDSDHAPSVENFSYIWLEFGRSCAHDMATNNEANRPLSRGGQVESPGNKNFCFCTSKLVPKFFTARLDVQNVMFLR